MKRKSLTFINRRGWLLAMLGGLSYIGLNVLIELVFPEHWAGSSTRYLGFGYTDYSRLLWIPAVLLLGALIAVYLQNSLKIGRWGQIGFLIAGVGMILDIFGSLIEFWICGLLLVPWIGDFITGSGCSNFGYSISGYGSMLLLVGILIIGLAGLRSSLPPRWRITLISMSLVLNSAVPFFIIDQKLFLVSIVAYGMVWILIGYLLRQDRAG